MKRQRWGLALVGLGVLLSLVLGLGRPGASQSAAVSGIYEDPQGRFQVAILEGYRVSSVGSAPLFEGPGGELAYTVAMVPGVDATAPLSEVALLAAAEEVFGSGEGFQPGRLRGLQGQGLEIAWSGQLSQGGPPQPVQGSILAKQQGDTIYLLLVAAMAAGAEQVEDAIATLAPTLQIP